MDALQEEFDLCLRLRQEFVKAYHASKYDPIRREVANRMAHQITERIVELREQMHAMPKTYVLSFK